MSKRRSAAEAYEKIPTIIHDSSAAAAAALAQEVKELITSRAAKKKNAILGLATGSTPVSFYRELIRLHREEGLSFKNVVTFNLDEYYGLTPEHPESYHRFMCDQLFDHIDIPKENIHLPSGLVPGDQVFEHCRAYEEMIDAAGGVDFQILGIGRTGHIGFNEPGSSRESLTRRITLDRITRQDAAADFRGEENVPRFAITMGVSTILRAKKIVLMAWGENKAGVVAKAVEGAVTDAVSASFLQEHPEARFFVDKGASRELTRVKLPWLVGPVKWSPSETRRAVCWLSASMNRPVLKLIDEDYNEHGLSDLLSEQGPAYKLNINIFNQLQHTISGWPGGKPNADDTFRPERAKPYPKRSLILSPEPQDAVVSLGSTVDRLVEQGHDIRLVAMSSGSLRVADSEADKFASTLQEIATLSPEGWDEQTDYARHILRLLEEKGEFGEDQPALRQLKSLILRGELRDAAHALGVGQEKVQFLNLPFYERGRYRRFKLGQEDTAEVVKLLKEFRPHQIYVTGDAADPSSVAALSFRALEQALAELQHEDWVAACSVWLYRGREKALEPWEIDMAVPASPMQLERKARALTRYQSLTSMEGEVTKVNQHTAHQYDSLGLANYEAIESFQRWRKV
ncbi:glucosamine-6-phosphate deaminase [Roseimicrobium sp. ORNL1]|uniref:glucosamine-6-phosphate deaminase n=1 Tax=Roseimicrobium sp. ORNL1 TaxID=2711231 RepID=UPI0013E0F508|nr:glucosamine-6-phosphate deaminase [Roseimicrobium sp. ORNL1]QIF01338.1 glucosamine-6-phosphate deaminase [Roseimicrobium sp. ORNL1]